MTEVKDFIVEDKHLAFAYKGVNQFLADFAEVLSFYRTRDGLWGVTINPRGCSTKETFRGVGDSPLGAIRAVIEAYCGASTHD